jgi:hypothetical protein
MLGDEHHDLTPTRFAQLVTAALEPDEGSAGDRPGQRDRVPDRENENCPCRG